MNKHSHTHNYQRLKGKFKIAVGFTFAVLVAEIVGGLLTNSLALLSDAVHVFADVFALGLSWFALFLSTLPADNQRTYGFHRSEVFSATINGISLIGISFVIFYEATKRIINPEPVESVQMLVIASIGLIVNLLVALILMKESHHNLNVKSAFLHVLGDAISSAGVIVGAIVMKLSNWYLVDPILSFAIGGAILFGAFRVTRDALHILLEGTPRHIDAQEVSNEIKKLGFVNDIHDLHIWSIRSDYTALSAHVLVDAQSTKTMQNVLDSINNMLREKFGIYHTTLQLECGEKGCMDSLFCNLRSHLREGHEDEEHA